MKISVIDDPFVMSMNMSMTSAITPSTTPMMNNLIVSDVVIPCCCANKHPFSLVHTI